MNYNIHKINEKFSEVKRIITQISVLNITQNQQ